MLLHHCEFVFGEPARLEQHGIGDADLADVVEQRGLLQRRNDFFRQAEGLADQPSVAADAKHVLARVVVAIFGGAGEAMNQVASRILKFGGPLSHGRFQIVAVVSQLVLVALYRQHVADARHQLAGVDGLVQEVGRAKFDGPHARFAVGDRRQNDDRNERYRFVAADFA